MRQPITTEPCFKPFRFAIGAPPPAPCILQTLKPLTAGERHGCPVRFERALQRGARYIGKCKGLFSLFSVIPSSAPRRCRQWLGRRRSPSRASPEPFAAAGP